ncbi:NAD-dependent epimerase/dehydratase family protein [Hylemonella gracilis]|uniref:NAD-dependent epimerase/dehydratase n=1 Tax=Hylemonella gracilis ATCC 19624 TaxID=887062 RepID=F3KSD3_9BURK|nr:NAD-dependent epimerase/dehydratase family protein [Hylemonella gracilis]EGI77327.1 NAD-dependent epimerase/dehydratase [Hylemonella gracilis ATCC 19624]
MGIYAGRTILVTGGAGYIGSLLVERLLALGARPRVIIQDKGLDRVVLERFGADLEIIAGDIRDPSAWGDWVRDCDLVFHMAAQTSHYEANRDPAGDWALNVAPVLHLAAALKNGKEPRKTPCHVVLASTVTVYGLTDYADFPVKETQRVSPLTVYDIHKFSAESFLGFFAQMGELSAVSLRLANVYGPSNGVSGQDRGVVTMLGRKALAAEPITVFGSGAWLRDYVHVNDVVDAFVRAGELKISGARVFNVCTGIGTPFIEMVRFLVQEAGRMTGRMSAIEHKQILLSPIDERTFVGSHAELSKATDWQPEIALQAGLTNCLERLNRP